MLISFLLNIKVIQPSGKFAPIQGQETISAKSKFCRVSCQDLPKLKQIIYE